jgi:peptide/nickel transport system substrate-binding protein
MSTRSATLAVALACLLLGSLVTPAVAAPEGEMTWAVHVSLAPTWFDPAETASVITPFMMLYALHDAMVKPMPGNPMTPSLAESWSVSKDGLAYDFTLRKGVKFHNGEPVTAEDVKFSLERYRGGAATTLKERVAGVDVVDPLRVRIRLKKPWPDFMTFYATPATGAAWIVPNPDIDGLFREQALELDLKKREALLHRIQQLMHERVMFVPIVEPAFISGIGPRVAESAFGSIPGHSFSYPYEDIRLKSFR